MSHPDRHAHRDERLRARVLSRRPLLYDVGADPTLDRPAHVRAASGLVQLPGALLVVQDDALFLALVTAAGVEPLTLPTDTGVRQFDAGRGNKRDKPDLEAACRWCAAGAEAVLAFGSGSTDRRERVLVVPLVEGAPGVPRFVDAAPLYALLRRTVPDAECNVEGAFGTGQGPLRLLQRGNGRGGVNAVCDVDGAWMDALVAGRDAPLPRRVHHARWELGALDGVRLSFTDGTALAGGRWLFSAAAEDSPDAVDDGGVTGSVVGWADDLDGAWAPVVDRNDATVPCKVEGVAIAGPGELWAVIDADDPELPSDLLRLRLEGPWPTVG